MFHANSKFASVNVSVLETPDGQGSMVTVFTSFSVDILREEQRIEVFIPKTEDPEKYVIKIYQSKVETCKTNKVPSRYVNTVQENFSTSSNFNYSCPIPKNFLIKITNLTITDKFMPPMPIEQNFRFNIKFFGMIKEQTGWVFLYNQSYFGRYKKWNHQNFRYTQPETSS